MKVRDVVKLIEADGWRFLKTKGSHHHFTHSTKPGKVTVPGHGGDTLAPGTLADALQPRAASEGAAFEPAGPAKVVAAVAHGSDAPEGMWTARGLSAGFRKSRQHQFAPDWYQVETVTGTHWAHESELRFRSHHNPALAGRKMGSVFDGNEERLPLQCSG